MVARRTPAGDQQLVAYYVPRDDADVTAADDLAAHCAVRLPDYMLPDHYVPLAEIPLNANGKTDRRALPAPDTGDPGTSQGRIAPRTVTEERLAEIWTDLLKVEPGMTDSFFHSGGNSILAIRLISRIQEEFDIDFAVRTVFEGPTVAQLAVAVEREILAESDGLDAAEPAGGPRLSDPDEVADADDPSGIAEPPEPEDPSKLDDPSGFTGTADLDDPSGLADAPIHPDTAINGHAPVKETA
ncbi:hypothetical protein GCM10018792_79320 [Streptomyces rubradiris]|nr:hypothetical protein GCM10018792_79320 [Streptomyces rubradiris]